MRFMLDTNMCIYMMKNNPQVLSAFEKNKNDGIAISSITLAELEFGVYNSSAFEKNKNKLISFLPLVDVLSFDGSSAMIYGEICATLRKKGTPIGTMDMLISAHAKSENLIVVTHNTREFERVNGLKLEDWAL